MATRSEPIELGSGAPPLRLPDVRGREFDLERDAAGRPALVMFMCNHCPYVKHVAAAIGALAEGWAADGVAVAAVNSNVLTHPGDAPALMAPFAQAAGWRFPYLLDRDQTAARAFHAACTPDVFLFDAGHRLRYHGQIDETRPSGDEPATGADLAAAVAALLAGADVDPDQAPGIGCSIKWLDGRPG